MYNFVHEGSIIPAKPPNGKFVLDVQKSIPAVLISNGVGITPMIDVFLFWWLICYQVHRCQLIFGSDAYLYR